MEEKKGMGQPSLETCTATERKGPTSETEKQKPTLYHSSLVSS
jgi:hypothetical protein